MTCYKIKLEFKMLSSTSFLERAILMLMENGVNLIYSEETQKTNIMSVLYPFSQERVASAIANLSNNEIISVDFQTKRISYTPIYKHLLHLIATCKFEDKEEVYKPDEIITKMRDKTEILKNFDDKISFYEILNYTDLRLVQNV